MYENDLESLSKYLTLIPCDNEASLENIVLPVDSTKTNGGDQIPYFLKSIATQKNESIPCEIEVTPLLRLSQSLRSSTDLSIGINAYAFTNFVIEEISENENGNKHFNKPNIRATTFAMAMGLHHKRFYGDIYVGKIQSTIGKMQNASLTKAELEACCYTPDLRLEIINALITDKSKETIQIPNWLINAMQENYRDGGSIVQLAKVMGLGENLKKDEINEEDDSYDDDDSESTESSKASMEDSNSANPKSETKSIFDSTLCIHCRGPTSTLCNQCQGVYFCASPRLCQQHGWSHQCLCATWKIYVDRRNELSTFPFDWHYSLISSPNFLSEQSYKIFLEENKFYNHGWWKTELGGWWAATQEDRHKYDAPEVMNPLIYQSYVNGFYGENHESEINFDPNFLPQETQIVQPITFQKDINTNMVQLHSWKDYYELRNISLSSPVALLLTFPLTMYYAIQKYGIVPIVVSKMLHRPMRMHVVGVEKEMNFLDLFREVGYLLPLDIQLELIFVVRKDMLPAQYEQQTTQKGKQTRKVDIHEKGFCFDLTSNIKIWFVSGTYGSDLDPNFDCGTGPPDMILGMNAGIYAYDSWRNVVLYLDNHSSVVGVFTDYNEHSAVNCAGSLGGGKCRASVSVNPFRQPRAMPVRCMNLPQFSNGFMYACNEQELDY